MSDDPMAIVERLRLCREIAEQAAIRQQRVREAQERLRERTERALREIGAAEDSRP